MIMALKRTRSRLLAPNRKSSLSVPWSQLPVDVLDNIISRLELPVDVVSFSGVCKLWHYVALGMHMSLCCKLPIYHVVPKRRPLPMLLHPGYKGPDTHRLYSLNEQKIYGKFHLQELSNKWIVGSGAGWLVSVDTSDLDVVLLNPLTAKKIPLPHLSKLPCCDRSPSNKDQIPFWCLRKAIVCSFQGGFLVVALVLRAICFCKIGDSEWTKIATFLTYIDDIIMHNGKLYAVDHSGALFEINFSDLTKMTLLTGEADVSPGRGKLFLVNLCGEMILIERLLCKLGKKKCFQVTSGFKIFKLVKHESGYSDGYSSITEMFYQVKSCHSWVQVENLDHHMVFIGYNHSVSVDSRIYPKCQGNCIYFADNRFDEYDPERMRGLCKKIYHDVGIYCMAEQKVKHFKHSSRASSRMNMVWLSPSLSSELEMEMLPR